MYQGKNKEKEKTKFCKDFKPFIKDPEKKVEIGNSDVGVEIGKWIRYMCGVNERV